MKNYQRKRRQGSVTTLAPFLLIMLCVFAGCMIDYGYGTVVRSQLQSAADAAAVAAAMRIGNTNNDVTQADAKLWAIGFANSNEPEHGAVLVTDDVVFGTWDGTTFTTSGTGQQNAVQVTVRRDGTNTDSVSTFFMAMFGQKTLALSAKATCMISAATSAEGLPLALRAPGFGDIDSKVSAANPGKDGPSYPANGTHFEVGEKVIVFLYGKGQKPPVHLALDTGDPGAESDAKKVLKGTDDPTTKDVSDLFYVFNYGTGPNSFGEALDARLDTADTDPLRDVIMPVVEPMPGARNDSNQLSGQVRVADFVSVHLDGVYTMDLYDPDTDQFDTISYIGGTVTNTRTTFSSGGTAASGAGGNTVGTAQIVN